MNTIFVSSTFRDMHYERDAIQELVHPRLQQKARTYGQSISFCDLRWGIDTSQLETEAGSKKVLDVCFDEIDRCQPPMVVILGDRYGWIPSEGLVDAVVQRRNLRLDDLEKSVTALEIEYGALRDPSQTKNTLFYFREICGDAPADYLPEDDDHACRMAALKEKIRRLSGGNIRTYGLTWNGGGFDGIDGFARMLTEDLEALLTDRWKRFEQMDPLEKELFTHRSYCQEKARAFRARKAFAGELLAQVEAGQRLTIVKAPMGSGKSTLISHVARQLEAGGWQVLTLFSGLTARSNTALGLLETMIGYLRRELTRAGVVWDESFHSQQLQENNPSLKTILDQAEGQDQSQESATRQQVQLLNELCIRCSRAGLKIALLIDAADQLIDDDARQKLVFLPTELSENVRFLMTCLPQLPVQGRPVTVMGPVLEQDKYSVISGILDSHNRELAPAVTAAMAARPASDNPLYLSFLVHRLLMMNREDFDVIQQHGSGMDAITAHQLELLDAAPDTLDAMSAALMDAAAQRIGGGLVGRVLELLAASRHGLRVEDLSAMLGSDFNMLDFAHFISYMSDCFLLREDGRYDFSHKSIREGLTARRNLDDCHQTLSDHLLSLDPADPLRRRELAWHLIAADRKAEFVALLSNADGELSAVMAQDAYEAALADNGAWLKALLEGYAPAEVPIALVHFLHRDFAACATGRFAECGILTGTLMALVYKVVARFNASRTPADADLVVRTYSSAAKVHLLLGTSGAVSQAKLLLIEVKKLLRQMIDLNLGLEYRAMMAQTCEMESQTMGDSLEAAQHQEEAAGHYQAYHDAQPTDTSARGLGRQYISLSQRYNGIFYCDLNKAADYAEKAVELFRSLRESAPSVRSDLDLADALQNLMDLACDLEFEDLPQLDIPKEILPLLEHAAQSENSLTVQAKMAACHSKAVPYYKNIALYAAWQMKKTAGGVENVIADEDILERAEKELYKSKLRETVFHGEKAVELYEAIRAELPSMENRRNLAISCENLAELYNKLDDPSLVPAMIRCYQTSLDLRESLYGEQGQEDDGFAMILSSNMLVKSLEHQGRSAEAEAVRKKYREHPARKVLEERGCAFAELLEIMRHMDKFYIDQVPKKMVMYIYDNCSLEYDFRMTRSIKDEKLRDETLRFLDRINRYYWAPSKEDKP